jgi:hypothetical protein
MIRIFLRHCIKGIGKLVKSKKNMTVCVLLAVLYLFQFSTRNPEIIHVVQNVATMDIVVKQPPLSQKGKIIWWEAHEAVIEKKYGSPRRGENGFYYVSILDGGNGFKKSSENNSNWFSFCHKNLYCFHDIKSEARCFENKVIMTVIYDGSNKVSYLIDNEEILKK